MMNRGLFALGLLVAVCFPAFAEGDVEKLIKQLDSDVYQERQAASKELSRLGKDAIPGLVKAAKDGNLETTAASIEILNGLMGSDDEATAQAAKDALKEISGDGQSAAAQRAADAIKPKEEFNPNQPNNNGRGGIIINGRPIQLRAIQVGGAQRVQMKNVNGVKEIEAQDGDRKIKIHDDPNNGIKMEITTKKNGKETTDKYEAKNAEELKKKHPKAYEEYQKFAKGGANNIQIQIGGIQGIPAIPGQRVLPQRILPAQAIPARAKIGGIRLQHAGRILPSYGRMIERIADQDAIDDADNDTRKEVKDQVTELKKQLEDLEKRLQDAIDKDGEAQGADEAEDENKADEDKEEE